MRLRSPVRVSCGQSRFGKERPHDVLGISWASLVDDIDRMGRELPYVFFAACPESDNEPCMVVDDDEFDLGEDVPAVAHRRGFMHGLFVDDVQQVIDQESLQLSSMPRNPAREPTRHQPG